MNWYYVENGQQAGPVSEERFAELCQQGKVQDDTLVWREGMPDWKPWGSVRTAGAPPTFGAPGGVVCAGCGQTFRPEEVIRVNDRFVCAACKPNYLQRVREGVAGFSGGGETATVSIEEVEAREYEHDLGDYVSRGWEFFKSDPGIIIGVSVLVYVCLMAVSMVPFGIGAVLQYILSGPLIGGLWRFYLKKQRGEPAGVNEGFSGFGPSFGQLLLAYLIPLLLSAVFMLPGGVLFALGMFLPEMRGSGGSPFDNPMGVIIVSTGGLFLLLGVCGTIYLSTCWLFTLPLVADKGMGFWPAMGLSRKVVTKHWWMTFLIMVVIGLLGSVGIVACCLGVLVSAPVAFASMAYAYQKLFGDMAQQG